jgi:hypothetical protein
MNPKCGDQEYFIIKQQPLQSYNSILKLDNFETTLKFWTLINKKDNFTPSYFPKIILY